MPFKRPPLRCRLSLATLLLLSGIKAAALAAPAPWQSLTFGRLPPLQQSGAFEASPAMRRLLPWNPSRQWQAGQSVDQVLHLSDFASSLQMQDLTLDEIAALSQQNLSALTLDRFPLLRQQTLGRLMQAIPALQAHRLQDVPVVRDWLNQQGLPNGQFTTLSALVQQQPSLAELSLAQLPLERYRLSSLPGLMQTRLRRFEGWQRTPIAAVPGLNAVPLTAFRGANANGMRIARVDVVFGNEEAQRTRSISGGYRSGFQVPCTQRCAHLELGQPFQGYQWISGLSQQVPGGHGVLGRLNQGLEPTGRHPFGPAAKVVLTTTDEATGTAQTALYFRICLKTKFVDWGCSPFFIGPVPFQPVREGGWIAL